MSRAGPRYLRIAIAGLLCLFVAYVLWRGVHIGWLTWQGVEAAQRLQADAGMGGKAGASGLLADRLPHLQDDLQLLDERLGALDAELRPLEPTLRLLQNLPGYGSTVASAPDLVASARHLAEAAAAMGPSLGWLLGVDAPRTYLLLVQNNHELRATGGFISAFGTLVVDQGRIAELSFVDSYELFSTEHEYPPAPEAMQEYMGIQLLVPRDANWSPDLPTAAETIRRLYAQESGREVDGIMTFDLDAVRHLITVLETVTVQGADTPITAENVEQELVRLWEQPPSDAAVQGGTIDGDWWSRRKDFVPLVAGAALAQLQAGDFNPAVLAAELNAALESRSIQVWPNHLQLQQVLAGQQWDGALHPLADADFLAVVDSNLGYNKVDAAIQRQLQYDVTWPHGPSLPAEARLTLTYTHPVAATEPNCDSTPRYGEAYADLIARCYFDYLRVFAPAGSQLVDVSGIDPETVTVTAGEKGTQQFAGYFVLPPNSTKSVTFSYRLPGTITPDSYNLRVQRQAGTDPLPMHVVVDDVERNTVLIAGEWVWRPVP